MAYTFPPRGFPQQENSQQIQPNSGRPPFPPYPPPRHVFHGTPMGNPTGHDIPSFGTENLQFGQRPPPPFMRFPNPRTVFRPPSHRGAWMGGPGPPMQFDTRTSQVRPCRPTSQFNQFSPTFTTDITTYESWPASSCQQPGKNAQQGQVGQAPQAHQGVSIFLFFNFTVHDHTCSYCCHDWNGSCVSCAPPPHSPTVCRNQVRARPSNWGAVILFFEF